MSFVGMFAVLGLGLSVSMNRVAADNDEVAASIRKLGFKQPKPTRIAAAKWLYRHASRSQAAAPALKRSVKSDPDPEVRSEAIKALALIVFQKKETRVCPLEIFEAWDDKDADVRMWARTYTALFILKDENKPNGRPIAHFPKGAAEILLRHAASKDRDIRAEAVLNLGYLAGNNAKALAAVKAAHADTQWWVRFHAALALRNATGDQFQLLRHNVGLLAFLKSQKPLTKAEMKKLPHSRRQMVYRGNLVQLGIVLQFGELTKDRPRETAEFLLKLLTDKSPTTRKETVVFLESCWAMPEAPRSSDHSFQSILRNKEPTKARKPTVPIGAWLKKFGLLKRLEEMSRSDEDEPTRNAARSALFKIQTRMKSARN